MAVISSKKKQWFKAYLNGFATQAEVMRQCKIKTRNDFYRWFHHVTIKNKNG